MECLLCGSVIVNDSLQSPFVNRPRRRLQVEGKFGLGGSFLADLPLIDKAIVPRFISYRRQSRFSLDTLRVHTIVH